MVTPTDRDVFLDSDGLIVGIWSETGAMRQILRLGEAEVLQLGVSSRVVEDVEGVVRALAPEALADTAVLLDRAGVEVLEEAPDDAVDPLRSTLTFDADAEVLACAAHHGAAWFLTYDWTDYLNNEELAGMEEPRIAAPGDFLATFTESLLRR